MSKYGKVEFEKEIDNAYDILWIMYERQQRENGGYNSEQEQKLLNIINFIDNELPK